MPTCVDQGHLDICKDSAGPGGNKLQSEQEWQPRMSLYDSDPKKQRQTKSASHGLGMWSYIVWDLGFVLTAGKDTRSMFPIRFNTPETINYNAVLH